MNTVRDIQFFASTKTFWNTPMCAAGPPNALHPSTTNERKMSLNVAGSFCARRIGNDGGSAGKE